MSSNELSFASFLSGNKQETTDTPVTNETIESSVVESQEASGTEATTQIENQEQVTPSTAAASVSLAALLEAKGVQVEGGDSEELYESVVSRALAGSQAMSELARLREELEALRATSQQTSSTAPQNTTATPVSQPSSEIETAAQQHARLFRELQKYDPLLENYVERDETGYAKPVASYGQLSIDAARQINEYQQASREQADRILRNPLSIVEDSRDMITKIAEERAQRIIDERLAAMRSEQERAAQEQAAAAQQKSLEQQQYEWHEANKAKIFHLGPDGEPKQDFLGGGGLAMTSTGQRFMMKLSQLREQIPGAPELTLRNLAIEFATAGQQSPAPAAPIAPAPVAPEAPAPVLTQSQQRQNLLAQNRQSIPNSNTPTATVREVMQSVPRLRLAEMAQLDPANAERISGWRQ